MRTALVILTLCLSTGAPSGQQGGLIPIMDIPQEDWTPSLLLQRCAAFYPEMRAQGLRSGLLAGILDLVQSSGQRIEKMAIAEAETSGAADAKARIESYRAAYAQDFLETDLQINLIESPNPLFQSDRAVCREILS